MAKSGVPKKASHYQGVRVNDLSPLWPVSEFRKRVLAGCALFCVGTASAFGWLLAYYKIPQELLANVSTWGMGTIAAGFFISFCFLVVGCFLDAIPAIIIVGTVLTSITSFILTRSDV